MPAPDYDAIVIPARSHHIRANKSWVLGRVLRDYELSVNARVMERVKPQPSGPTAEMREGTTQPLLEEMPAWEALRVSVFTSSLRHDHQPGVPAKDWVYWSGLFVAMAQICIAIVPLRLYGNWLVLSVTGLGIFLSCAQASLPQLRTEKWAMPTPREGKRHNTRTETVTLTQGNGSRHAMVILGSDRNALHYEIMASNGNRFTGATLGTKVFTALITLLWVSLLITVMGTQHNTWCKFINSTLWTHLDCLTL